MQKLLAKAIELSTQYHQNQFDKAGAPYILHCFQVMKYLESDDEELNCIAMLHDILEDTICTIDNSKLNLMTERIIKGVVALTKTSNLTADDYLNQIKQNPDAIKVKLCDLRHNLDIKRLKKIEQKDFERIVKYHTMYQELTIK
jgi:guanosine-3',5'-bis(diphosphate) 3'-pyrophosphohydrolase